jgi:CheY-like chemotaxis protein
MSETQTATPAQTATVYFIDDSATMREVIKIAFKKENIQVITCPSVTAAIEHFGKVRPDVVISDVIMPDRDGYELCSYVKQHAELGPTPVILMSGVVNRTVAEKATVVRADELLRKPFQPHELVARVKKLLHLDAPPESAAAPGASAQPGGATTAGATPTNGRAGLGDLFAAPLPSASAAQGPGSSSAAGAPAAHAQPLASVAPPPATPPAAWPASPPAPRPSAAPPAAAQAPVAPASAGRAPQNGAVHPQDVQRLRLEIQRLELLVKKLQSELEAERQYCQALEAHIRALQGAE